VDESPRRAGAGGLGAAGPMSAETGTAAEILALEAELRAATLAGDPVATDRLLAADWRNVDAEGRVADKAQLLAALGRFRFLGIEDAGVEVRVFPGVAVVSGRSVRRTAAPDGGERVRAVRFTRVWARPAGRWQVVAAQATPLAPP
jgi:ketosteroid isomerase-like protein